MNDLLELYNSLGIDSSDLEMGLRVLLQILLLGFSAVFSGSETALFSLSRIDLQRASTPCWMSHGA